MVAEAEAATGLAVEAAATTGMAMAVAATGTEAAGVVEEDTAGVGTQTPGAALVTMPQHPTTSPTLCTSPPPATTTRTLTTAATVMTRLTQTATAALAQARWVGGSTPPTPGPSTWAASCATQVRPAHCCLWGVQTTEVAQVQGCSALGIPLYAMHGRPHMLHYTEPASHTLNLGVK